MNHRPTRRLGAWSGLVTACLCLLALGGCGPDHEGLADDMVAGMERAMTIITGVKDDDDLKRAVKDLTALATDMQELSRKWSALGQPDEATRERLLQKFQTREAEWERSMEQTPDYFERNPQAMFELAGPLQQIGEAFGVLH